MKRYILMTGVVFCMLCACHHKSYEDLLVEKEKLSKELVAKKIGHGKMFDKIYQQMQKEIEDSLSKGLYGTNQDSVLIVWSEKFAYNTCKTMKIKQKVKLTDYLCLDYTNGISTIDSFFFTQPKMLTDFENYDLKKSMNKNLSFNPSKPGQYIWNGKCVIQNKFTGKFTIIPITDTILIY